MFVWHHLHLVSFKQCPGREIYVSVVLCNFSHCATSINFLTIIHIFRQWLPCFSPCWACAHHWLRIGEASALDISWVDIPDTSLQSGGFMENSILLRLSRFSLAASMRHDPFFRASLAKDGLQALAACHNSETGQHRLHIWFVAVFIENKICRNGLHLIYPNSRPCPPGQSSPLLPSRSLLSASTHLQWLNPSQSLIAVTHILAQDSPDNDQAT